jgi:Na+-driven multidrug efflux pump
VGGFIGAALTGLIGLLAAIFPDSWLHLFSHDADVLAPAYIYLKTVAPIYFAYGLGFVLMFAVQGTGHGLWGFMASSLRMLIAAGVGWISVAKYGANMQTLSTIVAASYVAFCLVTVASMFSKRVFPKKPS